MKHIVDGDEKTKTTIMLKYMNFSISDAYKYGKVGIYTDMDHGASLWAIPLTKELSTSQKEEKNTFYTSLFGESAYAILKSIGEYMTIQNSKYITDDMWYLSILGVNPSYQNQGLGKKLVEPILKEADNLKIATYLETFTLQNNSFYKRLGYEVVASIKEPTINKEYNLMIRHPH